MKVEVSNGELMDKISILAIKDEKGFDVSKERKLLEKSAGKLTQDPVVAHLYSVLVAINSQLWIIEDTKRECEKNQEFGERFVRTARLVYMLNDERAKIKKYIDRLSNSEISEVKSHRNY